MGCNVEVLFPLRWSILLLHICKIFSATQVSLRAALFKLFLESSNSEIEKEKSKKKKVMRPKSAAKGLTIIFYNASERVDQDVWNSSHG